MQLTCPLAWEEETVVVIRGANQLTSFFQWYLIAY